MAKDKKSTQPPPEGFTSAEFIRLETWMPEIASERLGPVHDDAKGFRVGDNRALVIHKSGTFHDFRDGVTGRGPIELIVHLDKCDQAAAVKVAKAWLTDHGGQGRLQPLANDGADEEAAEDDVAQTVMIKGVWEGAQPTKGTPAEIYLTSRGLTPSEGDLGQLRWLPRVRGDEGAMLAAITDDSGNLVANQDTYLTDAGHKSPHVPARRTFCGPHDWNVRGLVRFGNPNSRKVFICEGVEDALSARQAGAECVVALTGIARLRRIDIPADVEAVVIVRDDDAVGSPADEALWKGVVAVLGKTDSRASVTITLKPSSVVVSNVVSLRAPETVVVKDAPAGLKDVNDLHRHDPQLVKKLFDEATEKPFGLPERTINLIVEEVCSLNRIAWQRARERIAKLIGWKVGVLDKERNSRIAMRIAQAEKEGLFHGVDETPWPDPVTDIAAVLDAVVAEIGRYIRADIALLRAAVLWSAFAHAIHRVDLKINISPRLSIQSARSDSGKSTLLELLACLTPRADIVGSTTTASIFRKIGITARPTLLIDEADNILHSDAQPELKAVLNSGHRRSTAFVERTEKTPNGGWEVVRFPTFTAVAYAGIVGIGKARMPETLLNRSIIIFLLPATAEEQPEHLVDGESEALYVARRKIARFVADIEELPKIDRPKALLNRRGDNWYPLRQMAELAGGDWPQHAMDAATGVRQPGADPTEVDEVIALLEDIWQVFYERGVVRMHTRDLIPYLLDMRDGFWTEAHNGKTITENYLASRLKPILPTDPELLKQRRWKAGGSETKHGYTEDLLRDPWLRYLRKDPPSHVTPSSTPVLPDAPTPFGDRVDNTDIHGASSGASEGGVDPNHEIEPTPSEGVEGVALKTGNGASPPADALADAKIVFSDQRDEEKASEASAHSVDNEEGIPTRTPRGARPRRKPQPNIDGNDGEVRQ